MEMKKESAFSVSVTCWRESAAQLAAIRRLVFIDEQGVPEVEEWDEEDQGASHFLVRDKSGQAVATARLLNDGRIGRMAVLKGARGLGIGSALLTAAEREAAVAGLTEVYLSAQVQALPFYEKAGYRAYGKDFLDAGIPHRWMRKKLRRSS